MLLIILMILFGIAAISKGEFKLTNKKKVRGSVSRFLGVVLILGAIGGLIPNYGVIISWGLLAFVIVIGFGWAEKIEIDPPSPNQQ